MKEGRGLSTVETKKLRKASMSVNETETGPLYSWEGERNGAVEKTNIGALGVKHGRLP